MSSEIRALREGELVEHTELVYASYSHEREHQPGSMLTHGDWWLRSVECDPYYDLAQTRVMVMDGRLVSSVTCYLRPTYVAGRTIKAACIGSVCTHPDYRRRGLVRQVLDESAQWMVAEGFAWSFLYGLEAVYGGSGWRMLSSPTVTADVYVR
ncbi:MAG TPA: GNAT family N-acetyltransferase, partial [Armatimonadota bacterium]|nr:GNAT family N-acetyltransferase [Armatimonadota bacterium]